MSETTTTTELTPAEIEARRAAVEAAVAPQPEPAAAEPAAKPAPRKPAKAGDGTVTVRARKVLPAKNPLKEIEAKVKPAAAPKPAAKPAKPAKAKSTEVKFAEAFTRTFHQLLDDHGFKQDESPKPELVVFTKNGTRVEITNPSVPGGSKVAAFTVTRKSGKATEGQGRDALADALGIARLVR
jgi:hypothetical protein